MKVVKNIVFLGFAYELVWREATKHARRRVTLFKLHTQMDSGSKGVRGLFSNPAGTAIFILPFQNVDIDNLASRSSSARSMSKRWTGYTADLALRLKIPDSATDLMEIGELEKVEYTSDKLDRPGDRQGNFSLYTHNYKTPLRLYADRLKGPRVFGAKLNSKKIVTARGLVG